MFHTVTATAPASLGNVAIGFDVLGHALDGPRDTVTVVREDQPGVRLGTVTGLVSDLPDSIEHNACLAAVHAMFEQAGTSFGARVEINKSIPLSAGMGGSGASAVAAAAAGAALVGISDKALILRAALVGERAASGSPAWDNVLPALHGGLVMAAQIEPPLVRSITVKAELKAVLVHPALTLETRDARAVLPTQVALNDAIEQGRRLSAFVLGCERGDLDLIQAGLCDRLIEPARAGLVTGFHAVKAAALDTGALGCSLSGSGPSVFAWVPSHIAEATATAMVAAFAEAGVEATPYISGLHAPGVQIVPET